MICVIIQGVGKEEPSFSPLVYHQIIGNTSVLESVMKNSMDSAMIHKVSLTIPNDEMRKVQTLKRKGMFNRTVAVQYYDPKSEDSLSALYYAALFQGADKVVRVYGNCPFIPGWYINQCVVEWLSNYDGNNVMISEGPSGFRVEVIPFWILAREFVDRVEDRHNFIKHLPFVPIKGMTGDGQENFVFDSLNKAEAFNSIAEMIQSGYDVQDVIEEYADGSKQKVIKK